MCVGDFFDQIVRHRQIVRSKQTNDKERKKIILRPRTRFLTTGICQCFNQLKKKEEITNCLNLYYIRFAIILYHIDRFRCFF